MATRRFTGLFILLVTLTTACLGESQRPSCECPNTEGIVWSIDWLGDGVGAEMLSSSESFEGPWPAVGLTFTRFESLDDAQAAVDSLYSRLQAAGLVEADPIPAGEPNLAVGLELEGATVFIPAPLVDTDSPERVENPFYLCVEVEVTAGDESASKALQSLVAALGSID